MKWVGNVVTEGEYRLSGRAVLPSAWNYHPDTILRTISELKK